MMMPSPPPKMHDHWQRQTCTCKAYPLTNNAHDRTKKNNLYQSSAAEDVIAHRQAGTLAAHLLGCCCHQWPFAALYLSPTHSQHGHTSRDQLLASLLSGRWSIRLMPGSLTSSLLALQ